mmetsp:Transcript_8560/g.15506  ORF Transcript_8560/g.15506 Transcript_8560/m.15506 type:complete len:100 (+) Transcript_8560:585-884(+)
MVSRSCTVDLNSAELAEAFLLRTSVQTSCLEAAILLCGRGVPSPPDKGDWDDTPEEEEENNDGGVNDGDSGRCDVSMWLFERGRDGRKSDATRSLASLW